MRISCRVPSYLDTIYLQMSQWDEGLSQGREAQTKLSVAEPLTKKKLAGDGCQTGIFRAQLQEVAGSAGVSSWGQDALSCLRRRWPKEGGPKTMLSPHTHASGDTGSPEEPKNSSLFHKIKGTGRSPSGTSHCPPGKERRRAHCTGDMAQPLVSPTTGLCGMWALLPCQTCCNTSRETASRYQLGLPVLAVDTVRDTLGFLMEHVFFGWTKDTKHVTWLQWAAISKTEGVVHTSYWWL